MEILQDFVRSTSVDSAGKHKPVCPDRCVVCVACHNNLRILQLGKRRQHLVEQGHVRCRFQRAIFAPGTRKSREYRSLTGYLALSTLVLFLVLSALGFSTLVIPLAPVEC